MTALLNRALNSAYGFRTMGKQSRRTWSAEEKLKIVLTSVSSQKPNVQICREFNISEPTLYKWRQLFLEGARTYLDSSARPSFQKLATENQHLKTMIAELSLALRQANKKTVSKDTSLLR